MRSHGAENRKDRPDFYNKTACLASLIRAAESVVSGAELVFVNDGPVPADRERLMASAGVVLQGEYGSNRKSYRATLAIAAHRDYDDSDLMWFAEDDYLYHPNAFNDMLEAAARLPQADYFALFAGDLRDIEAAERPQQSSVDQSLDWIPTLSTTSSFAVGRRQLKEDVSLLRLMPFTGGAFDHTTSLTLQNRFPFTREELVADLLPFAAHPTADWPRAVTRGTVRLVLGTRSMRRRSRQRTLYGPTRDLVAHMEVGAFADQDVWEAIARESSEWAASRQAGTAPTATGS